MLEAGICEGAGPGGLVRKSKLQNVGVGRGG